MATNPKDDPHEAINCSPDDGERTEKPWPYWMVRYVGSDDSQAMDDLIWSVGGSPPFGGVSWDEATAVYELLEAYRGPGAAEESRYDNVRVTIASQPERLTALEIFHCADEIQSNSDSYGREPCERGLALAKKLGSRGAQATFLAFESGRLFRIGDKAAAADKTAQALDLYLDLAERDAAYETRAGQTAQNVVGMTAMSGDVARAKTLLQQLASVLDPDVAAHLRRSLEAMR